MPELVLVRGENFRLFERLQLEPHRRVNVIAGANAAGKTSLLEAIYCVGRGKSFRGSSPAELAGAGGRHWTVSGRFVSGGAPARSVGVRWTPEGSVVKLAGIAEASTLDLVRELPVQIMEPAMHRLLQDGPGYRRSFLDWGVFHVEHQFLPVWRRHQRALKQRNRALRLQLGEREVVVWNQELAETAVLMTGLRQSHLAALRPRLDELVRRVFGDRGWSVELSPGWSAEYAYGEVLERQIERDRRMGTTVEGAHRAELRLRLDQHQLKNRVSRGQAKLLIAALLLAQSELIAERTGRTPILLIDDFAAELAAEFQKLLLQMLNEYPGQLFLTAFERTPALDVFTDAAMFHVEHGQVARC